MESFLKSDTVDCNEYHFTTRTFSSITETIYINVSHYGKYPTDHEQQRQTNVWQSLTKLHTFPFKYIYVRMYVTYIRSSMLWQSVNV